MKKVCILLAGLVTGFVSFAQLSLGVQGSGSLSTARVTFQDATDISKKMKVFPAGGFVARYELGEHAAIQSGIHYLQNGLQIAASGIDPENAELGVIRLKATSKLNYIQVPLNFLYIIPAGSAQLYIGAGPFASYGITGTTTLSGTYILPGGSIETLTDKQDAFKNERDGGAGFKRFDWGAGFIGGARFGGKWFVQAGYQLSLQDIDPSRESMYKNRSAQLSVGYFFLDGSK